MSEQPALSVAQIRAKWMALAARLKATGLNALPPEQAAKARELNRRLAERLSARRQGCPKGQDC